MFQFVHRGCQTDKASLDNKHYGKIWQKERESELAMARDTAVALARASWEKESEKAIRTRVDIIVRYVWVVFTILKQNFSENNIW